MKKSLKEKVIVYCDMDGVLADFGKEPRAIERFEKEVGFFNSLSPIKRNVKGLIKLINKGFKVKIISQSPNERADNDKIRWLLRYLPMIERKDMIFTRPNNKKISYINNEDRKYSILIDDYRKHILEWVLGGGFKAFKIDKKKDKKLPEDMVIKSILELV